MLPKKKLSGAAFRKKKKEEQSSNETSARAMTSWIRSSRPVDSNEGHSTTQPEVTATLATNLPIDPGVMNTATDEHINSANSESDTDESLSPCEVSISDENETVASSSSQQSRPSFYNAQDPGTWPNTIVDDQRVQIVKTLFNLPRNYYSEIVSSTKTDRDGRNLTTGWFHKTLQNEQKVERSWLAYSVSKNSLYCISCKLFPNTTENVQSSLALSDGLYNWKKLSERIPEHENSFRHKDSFCSWRLLENSLSSGGIDRDLEDAIKMEEKHWKEVLRAVVDIIMVLAKEGSSFRGTLENIEHRNDPKSGRFLNLVELISHYNEPLRKHLERHRKKQVTYFSHKIQDEFIAIIANQVLRSILSEIESAKYYSILYDCTPDISHTEQMSQVIRYVVCNEEGCVIKESFTGFINVHQKTGEGLTKEIMEQLENLGLDIRNCRGQSYDNGANMAGKTKGVQARIREQNELAKFVPCAAHSLNLIGVNAAKVVPEAQTFFGIIQRLFVFFSGSTGRWEVLKKNITIMVKRSCDTRWSSKQQAVRAVFDGLPGILDSLDILKNDTTYEEIASESSSLVKNIRSWQFLCMLSIWNRLLSFIDRINKLLQSKNVTIDIASKHVAGLLKIMQEEREKGIETTFKEAKTLAEKIGLDPHFPPNRSRKKRKMPGEDAEDEAPLLSAEDKFKTLMFTVIDKIIMELNSRFQPMIEICNDFNFLQGENICNLSLEDLKKHTADLALKYDKDLNAVEFHSEIESLKHHAAGMNFGLKNASPLQILTFLYQMKMAESYPNVATALKIFLTLPVTVASCERSFSKLKIIKTYLRSTMQQDRLSNLGIISIENEMAQKLDYDIIISNFATSKVRKVKL